MSGDELVLWVLLFLFLALFWKKLNAKLNRILHGTDHAQIAQITADLREHTERLKQAVDAASKQTP